MEGKTLIGCLLPLAVIGDFDVVALRAVIVYDNLFRLPVTFTRGENNGARILQHGNEVGDDDGLCKKVFIRTKQVGTLPAPQPFLLVVEASMAGPE